MIRPKKVVEPYPNPKNNPLGPQKVKKDPESKLKSKVKIERNIENESCSNRWVDPKTVGESYPNPKNANQSPQKSKMTPKLTKNKYQNWRKDTKWKLFNTWVDPKTVFEPFPNPKK